MCYNAVAGRITNQREQMARGGSIGKQRMARLDQSTEIPIEKGDKIDKYITLVRFPSVQGPQRFHG